MGTVKTKADVTEDTAEIVQEAREHTAHIDGVFREDGTISRYWVTKEATEIAKVIQGIAPNNSENAQEAIVWLILNRVEGVGFPDTVTEVCQQKYQWGAYGTPSEDLITRVYRILMQYYRGTESKFKGYFYMDTDKYRVTLRDTWEKNKSTKYMEVK